MCSIQAGHGESRAAFQAPGQKGNRRRAACGEAGLCLGLCEGAAPGLGCIPAGHHGAGWMQGVVTAALWVCCDGLRATSLSPVSRCPPGSAWMSPQREGTSSPTDLAGQPGLVPLCWKRLSPRSPAEGTRGAGPRAVPPHRMSPEPLPWPAPPPGLFPRPENNTSPSIQETFIT